MKSSVGVTLCAVALLFGALVAWAIAVGTAYVFMGPMSRQLVDPANLPPGADVSGVRVFGLVGAFIFAMIGSVAAATGIGLIRLWRWARYAVIAIGICIIGFSALSALMIFIVPLPPPPDGRVEFQHGFRIAMSVFYFVWAAVGAGAVFFFMRPKTVSQFQSGVVVPNRSGRPVSITIIAWLMIVSGAIMLPWAAFMHMPSFFLGVLLTGTAAAIFFVCYTAAYVAIGVGLLKKNSAALTAAIVLHVLAAVNALLLMIPSVWSRFETVMQSRQPFLSTPVPPAAGVRYFAIGSGVIFSGLVLFLLLRYRARQARTDETASADA